MNNSKVCVLYHYYEKDESYAENLRHFLNFGIVDGVDFYIILAGGHCSLEIECSDNVVVFSAANKNFDYGGYSEALNKLVDRSKYDYFIFVNSSVRGPFIPPYALGNRKWFEYFLDFFSDGVGIVGASINILGKESRHYINYGRIFGGESLLAHVQTPAFALRRESLQVLDCVNFFDVNNEWSREEVVSRYEINLSRTLIDAGWNLKCFLPEFNLLDYRRDDLEENLSDYMLGDVLFESKYLGRTVHPYEVMFVKTGRGLWPASYLRTLAGAMSLACGAGIQDGSDCIDAKMVSSNAQFFKKKVSIGRSLYRYIIGRRQ